MQLMIIKCVLEIVHYLYFEIKYHITKIDLLHLFNLNQQVFIKMIIL